MDDTINDLIQVKNIVLKARQRQIRSWLSCEATRTRIERTLAYIETYRERVKSQRKIN